MLRHPFFCALNFITLDHYKYQTVNYIVFKLKSAINLSKYRLLNTSFYHSLINIKVVVIFYYLYDDNSIKYGGIYDYIKLFMLVLRQC